VRFPGAVRSMGPASEKKQAMREVPRIEKVYGGLDKPPLKLYYIWAVSVKKAEKREMEEKEIIISCISADGSVQKSMVFRHKGATLTRRPAKYG